MQGDVYHWLFREKLDIAKIEAAYRESMHNSDEYFEDTIRTIGGTVKIYLCNPYYEEEVPVIQLLLELYHKTPYDVYGKPVEPNADWDCGAWYDKLPRTFEYYGKTYCYDDGKIEKICEYGYMENNGDEWQYYEEDDDKYFYPKDFKNEIILRWACGKSTKKWKTSLPLTECATICSVKFSFRKSVLSVRFFRCHFFFGVVSL